MNPDAPVTMTETGLIVSSGWLGLGAAGRFFLRTPHHADGRRRCLTSQVFSVRRATIARTSAAPLGEPSCGILPDRQSSDRHPPAFSSKEALSHATALRVNRSHPRCSEAQ